MSNIRAERRQKINAIFNLTCQIATKETAREVVLICRPIDTGVAITCRAEDRSIIGLRFYLRLDDNVVLVRKLDEEVVIGKLDNAGIQDRIAGTILNNLLERSRSKRGA